MHEFSIDVQLRKSLLHMLNITHHTYWFSEMVVRIPKFSSESQNLYKFLQCVSQYNYCPYRNVWLEAENWSKTKNSSKYVLYPDLAFHAFWKGTRYRRRARSDMRGNLPYGIFRFCSDSGKARSKRYWQARKDTDKLEKILTACLVSCRSKRRLFLAQLLAQVIVKSCVTLHNIPAYNGPLITNYIYMLRKEVPWSKF